jgi:signal transduction histidine kinase
MLRAIHTFARFARLASESAPNAEALQLLADSLVEQAGSDASGVFQVTGGQVVLSASRNVPERLRSWCAAADVIDSTLGRAFMSECGAEFTQAETLMLVSSGGLFGAVILLWKEQRDDQEPWRMEVARGLVDLAATVLSTSARVQALVSTNAELRKSREMLARSEKLRALGQMAAGVSHDLRNLLNPLSLHLQLVQRANARGDTARVDEGVREMKDALARGVDVLERLRHFSRQTPDARFVLVDLNAHAHEAVLLAKSRLTSPSGRGCRVVEDYGVVPRVLAEPGEVVSAVLNLVVNAVDAMTMGGEITIRTGERDGGGWITVADQGPGIPAEVQARVFEPFFTTKGEQGTGLGLAMVYAAVRRHGGSVSLESETGKGAAFTLWFPLPPPSRP